jgi:N-acyl-L-homoserine lactone synthetase
MTSLREMVSTISLPSCTIRLRQKIFTQRSASWYLYKNQPEETDNYRLTCPAVLLVPVQVLVVICCTRICPKILTFQRHTFKPGSVARCFLTYHD